MKVIELTGLPFSQLGAVGARSVANYQGDAKNFQAVYMFVSPDTDGLFLTGGAIDHTSCCGSVEMMSNRAPTTEEFIYMLGYHKVSVIRLFARGNAYNHRNHGNNITPFVTAWNKLYGTIAECVYEDLQSPLFNEHLLVMNIKDMDGYQKLIKGIK